MNALQQVGAVVVMVLLCWGAGHIVLAVLEAATRALGIVVRRRFYGVGHRLCVPCDRVTPALLGRHGRWTCLDCLTNHPDPTARR